MNVALLSVGTKNIIQISIYILNVHVNNMKNNNLNALSAYHYLSCEFEHCSS
jgi:hypothetical protein